jgi:hypothetical protein
VLFAGSGAALVSGAERSSVAASGAARSGIACMASGRE